MFLEQYTGLRRRILTFCHFVDGCIPPLYIILFQETAVKEDKESDKEPAKETAKETKEDKKKTPKKDTPKKDTPKKDAKEAKVGNKINN